METRRTADAVRSLATSIQHRIRTSPKYSGKRGIYRVPARLRETNKGAYTPELVSIGPLHHSDVRLLPFEAHKLKYLESFLHDSRGNSDLNSYLRIVKNREPQIRAYYADHIDLSSDDFTQLVLIDSVFLIEYLRRCDNFHSRPRGDDYIFRKPFMNSTVYRDIIRLAENQLPFFIVAALYRKAFNPSADDSVPSFTDLACRVLGVNKRKININANNNEADKCWHLLDLCRSHYKPEDTIINDAGDVATNNKSRVCPSATNLHEAGVKLQVISSDDDDSSKLLDIHFDAQRGVLSIPKLLVEDGTENKFRNLIAFEQCHYTYRVSYFTDYQYFLNCLINTPEDVQLLAKAGIIDKMMGSNEEVCDFIISSSKNTTISFRHYNYMDTTQQLIRYCDKRWNRYRAALKHTYLKHPWAVISLGYAAILLIFTCIQVILSIRLAMRKKE